MPVDPPASAATLVERYTRTAAGPPSPAERWYNWAVAPSHAPDRPFGTVETTLLADRRALLAYALGPAAWGRGYAAEACGATLAFLRERTPVAVVEALVDTRNARSIALLERLGFARRATIVDADYFKGSPSHEFRYALALVKDPHGKIEPR